MVLIDQHQYLTQEEKRLREDRERTRYWKRWGPYVAERQWATGWSCFSFILFFWCPLVVREGEARICWANGLIVGSLEQFVKITRE